MRVLPAVLAHARRIVRDPAGERARSSRRRAAPAAAPGCRAPAARARSRRRGVPARSRPRPRAPARRPSAHPRRRAPRPRRWWRARSARRATSPASAVRSRLGFGAVGVACDLRALSLPREIGEGDQHVVQEEAEPDALAAPRAPDAVERVVPVAASEQRQAVRAPAREGPRDRAPAVLVDRGGVARDARREHRPVHAARQPPRPPGTAPSRRAARDLPSRARSARPRRAARGARPTRGRARRVRWSRPSTDATTRARRPRRNCLPAWSRIWRRASAGSWNSSGSTSWSWSRKPKAPLRCSGPARAHSREVSTW